MEMQSATHNPDAVDGGQDEYSSWESRLSNRLEIGEVQLPIMPTTASQALRLANDPNLELHHLARLVENDPAVAANIIRVASSAMYGGTGEVSSLKEAITRIGMRTFCHLVGAFVIQGEVYGGENAASRLKQMCRHSMYTAKIASQLADKLDRDEGSAFLCGLLLMIGKPAVWHLINDLQGLLVQDVSPEVMDQLVEKFHVQMAGLICEEWELPDLVKTVCAGQDAPDEVNEEHRPQLLIAEVADRLAHKESDDTFTIAELESMPQVGALKLTVADLESVMDAVDNDFW